MSSQRTSLLKESPTAIRPSAWRSYFELTRLHKFPTGTLLVFWPCAWGLTMAAYTVSLAPKQLAVQMAAFFVGSTILHSAACVINDICDRDFDRQVERTKNRPLVVGSISVFGATVFLLLQVVIAIGLLGCSNKLAFQVGLLGVFPLHALYPLMKRWTYWPQAWLGLAMNWGVVVSWISITGSIDWKVLPVFFFGTCCWTIVYDTIYACQDKRDDIKAGVKSTALLFGDYVRFILSIFALATTSSFAYAGWANGQGPAFFIVSVAGSALHFLWQLGTLNVDEPADCWQKFNANGNLGYVVWAGLLLDYYLKVLA